MRVGPLIFLHVVLLCGAVACTSPAQDSSNSTAIVGHVVQQGQESVWNMNSSVENPGSSSAERRSGQPPSLQGELSSLQESPSDGSSLVRVHWKHISRLAQEDMQHLFGPPVLVWREGEAEVWQYRFSDCVAHLFFHPRGNDGLRLHLLNVYDLQGELQDRDSCLRSSRSALGF